MMHRISILLALGAMGSAIAAPLATPRTERTFRQDASSKMVYADLLVAYEQPQAGVIPPVGGVTPTIEAYLKSVFIETSKELHKASGGAVQLGKITIIPASEKSDPDVLILADNQPASQPCPGNLQKPDASALVCADASTGGYVGTAWWKAPKTAPGVGVVFEKVPETDKVGSRVNVSWKTIAGFDKFALVHELGHYLFAMRDEYEGPSFTSSEAFEDATEWDPRDGVDATHPLGRKGAALYGALASSKSWTFLPDFNGYPMGYVSSYKDASASGIESDYRKFSPYQIDITLPIPVPKPEGDEELKDGWNTPTYAVAEQFATLATRRSGSADGLPARQFRHGGLWSMETSIRTALGTAYTRPTASIAYDNSMANEIVFVGPGQHNVFVFDASGSMGYKIVGPNPANLVRRDVAVDFFGRLTHDELWKDDLRYPTGAKFGFVAFSNSAWQPFGEWPTLAELKNKTVLRTTPLADLVWKSGIDASTGDELMPTPQRQTNLTEALSVAYQKFQDNTDKPVQRNLVLISDGDHYIDDPDNIFTGEESKGKNYRLFLVSLDTKLELNGPGVEGFGDKMTKLASQSEGLDGRTGEAYFANGYTADGDLADAANQIANKIAKMDVQSFPETKLYADAGALEYSLVTDASQTRAQFSLSWVGNIEPTLMLSIPPYNQSFPEGNANGITFRKQKNFKVFDLDLTKFPAGTWKMKVSAPQAVEPISIFPSIASKSSKLQVNVKVDPKFLSKTGLLPVSVVAQDGTPVEGLNVTAKIAHRETGVIENIPLKWNGASYAGSLGGSLQPGHNDLQVSVIHPNNGKVFHAAMENEVPVSQRTPYPYFAMRNQTQQLWIAGTAVQKSIPGLEVWTINTNPRNFQGTSFKLFVKNNTTQTWKDLKVRYFFSVSEYPNGIPGFNRGYLPQSKVTVGEVDNRDGLSYVEYDFTGITLLPGESTSFGTNQGEDGSVIEANWSSAARWNPANDWSFQGLKTTWSVNSFVNIYDKDNKLISGNPDLEKAGMDGNAAPVVSISHPDLMVVGIPNQFIANAIDPESDPLTYVWLVDGQVVSGQTSSILNQTFSVPGNHIVTVYVRDGKSGVTTVEKQVVVQATAGACTDLSSSDLGPASTGKVLTLSAGTNCFVVKKQYLPRDWKWSKVQFQVNSNNGSSLLGLTAASVPNGSNTTLSGYSQTVPFNDPGRGTNLYLKIQASTSRSVRLNWWLQ